MNKEELKLYIKDLYKSCGIQLNPYKVKIIPKDILSLIDTYNVNFSKDTTLKQKLYNILNDKYFVCICICGKPVKFENINTGYNKSCSNYSCASTIGNTRTKKKIKPIELDKDTITVEIIKEWLQTKVLDKNGNVHRSKLPNTNFHYINKVYYDYLFEKYNTTDNFKECVYLVLNNLDEIPKCECGNNINFRNTTKSGYHTYCSPKCASEFTVEKRKEVWTEIYGVEHPLKSNIVVDKIKETVKNRDKEVTKEIYEKLVQSRRDDVDENGLNGFDRMVIKSQKTKAKNGTLQNSEVILAKSVETHLHRYGAKHYVASEIGKTNMKNILLEKYGVTNPSFIPFVRKKISKNVSIAKRNFYNNLRVNDKLPGILYIFESKELDLIKIGVTLLESTEQRYKQIKKQINDLECLYTAKSDNVYKLEAELHSKYKEYNTLLPKNIKGRTEWFNSKITNEVIEHLHLINK